MDFNRLFVSMKMNQLAGSHKFLYFNDVNLITL